MLNVFEEVSLLGLVDELSGEENLLYIILNRYEFIR